MLNRKSLAAAVFCFVLVGLALAAADAQMIVTKKDGTILKGRVLSDNGAIVVMRVKGKEVKLEYGVLTPDSVYRLRAARIDVDDAGEQFRLGTFALDNKLFHAARKHYVMALTSEPDDKGKVIAALKRVDVVQRKSMLAMAKKAKADGDYGLEAKLLQHIMTTFPESDEGAEAEKMLAEAKLGKGAGDIIDRLDKATQRKAAQARKLFATALEQNRKGLASARKMKRAANHFNGALKNLRSCQRIVDQVDRQYAQNPDVQERIKESRKKIDDMRIQILINQAHVYTQRQSFIKALEYVSRALAIDPDSQLARESRNRIELAMSMDGGRGIR